MLLLVSQLLFGICSAAGREQDIYYVMTGESPDVPLKRRLDPVYYVGVYDQKPKKMPREVTQTICRYSSTNPCTDVFLIKQYEIEIMTADSGKRFTCIIPQSDGLVNAEKKIDQSNESTEKDKSNSDKDDKDKINENDNSVIINSQKDTAATHQEQPKVPQVPTKVLLKEVDTLDNRDRYVQEYMIHDLHVNEKKYKRSSCYYAREGYWNYEVCLYSTIEQYHGPAKKRDPKIGLGKFVTYIDASKILKNDKSYPYLYLKDTHGAKVFEDDKKYFAHLLYTGGDGKRQSLVSLYCSRKEKDGPYSIQEPKVHHYHFTFVYNAVCDYEAWLLREYNIPDDGTVIKIDPNTKSFNDSNISNATSSEQMLFDKNIDPNSDDIALLLSPLLDLSQNNKCLMLKQGWWTVEFCYGKFIRQIHLEPKRQKNKKGQVVNSLTEMDIKQEHVIGRWKKDVIIDKDSFIVHKNEEDPKRTYASIIYADGDECDLSKRPRMTEIQFRCGLNMAHSELVKTREDPSCKYTAVVNTPLLCHHPDFKIPSAPTREIVCYPFDEREFVDDASVMKEAIDIQSETDAILRMVTNTARFKQEREKEKKLQKEKNKKEKENKDESSNTKQKTEL